MVTTRIAFLFILTLTLSACVKNPGEGIPTYIKIDAANFVSPDWASNSAKVSDIDLSIGNTHLGQFELPMVIPALGEGEQELTLLPAVLYDGLSDRREFYSFYGFDSATIQMQPGDTITLSPTFRYTKDVVFEINQRFENGNGFSNSSITSINPISGNGSGRLVASSNNRFSEALSSDGFTFETGSLNFVEFDYRSNTPFTVGVVFFDVVTNQTLESPLALLNPTDVNTHIYLNFTNTHAQLLAQEYQFFLRTELPDSMEAGEVIFDNVRSVHF